VYPAKFIQVNVVEPIFITFRSHWSQKLTDWDLTTILVKKS